MQVTDLDYEQTLQFLYDQLPMFTRVGAAAYKPDLLNTLRLSEKSGNPHLKFKSIHIAGTNGKGSCSSLLAAALQKSGYKTALYTSPHIIDFRERIKVDGIEISKDFVVDFVAKNRIIIDEIKPSFFELTVVMAFTYFAEQQVDIAVIEVGLGGLLDSTNIITPEVAVITNISNDHGYLLGSTLAEIATQKAGIIKKEIPVVIGETQTEIEKIFITKAVMSGSPLFFADNKYNAVHTEVRNGKQYIKIIDKVDMQVLEICTDLMGSYQSKNIMTALATMDVLKSRGWAFPGIEVETVFATTKALTGLKGRYDVVSLSPKIICDVSHNEAGIKALFKQINEESFRELRIITGFVKDKELDHIIKLFPANAVYYFVEAPIPRALPKEELMKLGAHAGLKGNTYNSIAEAVRTALAMAHQDDLILVTGSFFILDEVYNFIENNLH